MFISDFDYHRPQTIEDACRLLQTCQDGVLLAGGTDLLVDLKQGKRRSKNIISLASIPEFQSIHLADDKLYIGAGATHNHLVDSTLIREHWPAIAEAAGTIGTEQIRNTATVGGNLCTAASCSDTAPILIACQAEVELVRSGNKRMIPLEDFFVSHRTTALESGEILTGILVPLPRPVTGASYQKFGLREAANIAVASVAVKIHQVDDVVAHACFVMGAVAPTPKISGDAARLVEGQASSELSSNSTLLDEVGQAVAEEAEPIDDIRGSARFRREVTAVLARRALTLALERARPRGHSQ